MRKINLSRFTCKLKSAPVLFLAFFTSSIVMAGSYELLKGKGVEVCEAYQQNLNAFNPPIPQRCHRKIHPSAKGFSKPKLKRFYSNEKTMEKIIRFLWKRDANPVYYIRTKSRNEWQGTTEQYSRAWRRYFKDFETANIFNHQIISLDIDNDGELDNVYFERACNVYGARLIVLNKDKTDIDYVKTEWVMRHPSRKEAGWPVYQSVKKGDWGVPPSIVDRGYMKTPDALHNVYYDVFNYKGQTYFDQWWKGHIDFKGKSDINVGKLRVYTIEDNKPNEVCTFDYQMTDSKNITRSGSRTFSGTV